MNESITCPKCGITSFHPDDIREGYCGHCHDWTTPTRGWVGNLYSEHGPEHTTRSGS